MLHHALLRLQVRGTAFSGPSHTRVCRCLCPPLSQRGEIPGPPCAAGVPQPPPPAVPSATCTSPRPRRIVFLAYQFARALHAGRTQPPCDRCLFRWYLTRASALLVHYRAVLGAAVLRASAVMRQRRPRSWVPVRTSPADQWEKPHSPRCPQPRPPAFKAGRRGAGPGGAATR